MPTSSPVAAKATHPHMGVATPVFADNKARIAWEIGQQITKLSADLPVETPTMSASTISFESAHRTRGIYAVLLAGTFVGTAEEGVFVVPERTLTVLQKLGIPYQERQT